MKYLPDEKIKPMEQLGSVIDYTPFVKHEWKRDLQAWEGPLLSLFYDMESDTHYLYYWFDCDSQYNRWMVAPISNEDLINLIEKKTPVLQILLQSDPFLVDIDSDNNNVKIVKAFITNSIFIRKYLPLEDFFLDDRFLPDI